MFTGIVESVGTVIRVDERDGARRLTIAPRRVAVGHRGSGASGPRAWHVEPGDSVAISGVCLTVVQRTEYDFDVQAVGETLERTTLGSLERGHRVNLERALALGDRLGGHLVQGHVDGIGIVRARGDDAEHVFIDIEMPDEVAELTVARGSIAVDGVSLTVADIPALCVARVMLIPFTREHTTLGNAGSGSRVNLEGDMISRFVLHHMRRREAPGV